MRINIITSKILGTSMLYNREFICINRENLPGHFKFKEYCPRVFHDLRRRFKIDDIEYMVCYYLSLFYNYYHHYYIQGCIVIVVTHDTCES